MGRRTVVDFVADLLFLRLSLFLPFPLWQRGIKGDFLFLIQE
jgi:hypothetical protein